MRVVKTSSKSKREAAATLAYALEGRTFKILVEDSEALWVVLDEDGSVVGAAGAKIKGDKLYLTFCFVAPEFQGLGLQKRLIELRLRWGKRQGCEMVHTYTYRENHASMASLVRSNFSPYYVGKNYAYFSRAL